MHFTLVSNSFWVNSPSNFQTVLEIWWPDNSATCRKLLSLWWLLSWDLRPFSLMVFFLRLFSQIPLFRGLMFFFFGFFQINMVQFCLWSEVWGCLIWCLTMFFWDLRMSLNAHHTFGISYILNIGFFGTWNVNVPVY